MTDIIERLRDRDAVVLSGLFHAIPVMNEAAKEIERLRLALSWIEDYEPGLVSDARERFLTQQDTRNG